MDRSYRWLALALLVGCEIDPDEESTHAELDVHGSEPGDPGQPVDALASYDTLLGGPGEDAASCPAEFSPVVKTDGNDAVSGNFDNECLVLLGGNDSATVTGAGPSVVLGGSGADSIVTAGPAVVAGHDGNDSLSTGNADDDLFGGPGADTLSAGGGDDFLNGGSGNDSMSAGSGSDEVLLGTGADSLSAGGGDDRVVVRNVCELDAPKVLSGGSGTDTLILPVDLATAQGLGLVATSFEVVLVAQPTDCGATCDCDAPGPDSDNDGSEASTPPFGVGGETGDPMLPEQTDYELFLEALADEEPVGFEFIGTVPILTIAEAETATAARQQALASLSRVEYDALAALEPEPGGDDLAVMVSADGRMFREIPGFYPQRGGLGVGSETTAPQAGAPAGPRLSGGATPDAHPSYEDEFTDLEKPPLPNIWGCCDGRELRSTSTSQFPWRAVGVALWDRGTTDADCSGGMISHRVVFTAAHCVSPDGNSLRRFDAVPGARGEGFAGDRSPFSARFVSWYVWPNDWEGQTTARYDYAMLILQDIDWSPGHVHFRDQGVAYSDKNTAGFPGEDFDCAAAPAATDPECGGYMYRQFEEIRSAGFGYFYHEFDQHDGQSGSPVYSFDEDTGKRRIVGNIEGEVGKYNTAHKINSNSVGFLCKVIDGTFTYQIGSELRNALSSFFPNPHC